MTRTPVTLVTGFLGSGKTTLLVQALRAPELADAAVLVNELGEIALDHHLLRRIDESTVVLASGCVCCTIRQDLADELRLLEARRHRGEIPDYRRVVIETTGLADPVPVLSTFLQDPLLEAHYASDGVITTVDAVNAPLAAARQREWVKQVALADRIVLTKADIAGPDEVAAATRLVREINLAAPLVEAAHGALDAALLVGAGLRDETRRVAETLRWLAAVEEGAEPDELPEDAHAEHAHGPHGVHDHRVQAHAIRLDAPLDWAMFGIWLSLLVQARGDDVLRIKGLLDTGGAGPLVVNGVQHVIHAPVHLDAWPDDDRSSRLVLIVRDIPRAELVRSLLAFDALAR